MILSDNKIKGLKPKKSSYYVWHDAGSRGVGRIGVKVYSSGRKAFYYRYYDNGKRKFVHLGDYPDVHLSQAIQKSKNCVEIKNDNALASLEQLFLDYILHLQANNKRSWKTTENRLKQVINSGFIEPNIPANEVTPTHIKLVLADAINRGAIAGSNKIRAALHAAFNFGLYADNDPANLTSGVLYGLTHNPVSIVPKQQGYDLALDRFLSWDEMIDLIKDCYADAEGSALHYRFKNIVLLCIYTGGQRPHELICNTWDNIDFDNKTLTIPPELSKMKNHHVVPLCKTAINILKGMESSNNDGYLFPANVKSGHLETSEFAKQIKKYCEINEVMSFTPRDIRRTFKTLAGELGISSEMRDRLQNHKIQGVSTKHYDRYNYLKEKFQVIEQWESEINSRL